MTYFVANHDLNVPSTPDTRRFNWVIVSFWAAIVVPWVAILVPWVALSLLRRAISPPWVAIVVPWIAIVAPRESNRSSNLFRVSAKLVSCPTSLYRYHTITTILQGIPSDVTLWKTRKTGELHVANRECQQRPKKSATPRAVSGSGKSCKGAICVGESFLSCSVHNSWYPWIQSLWPSQSVAVSCV